MITAERSREIAEKYYKDVYKFCRSQIPNEDDAQDLTQEVFLLFQKKYNGMDDKNIKGWLYNVAQKKIFEKFREIKKNEKVLSLNDELDGIDTDSLIIELDSRTDISEEKIEKEKSRILERLTPQERELFKMIYIQHLKYSEIAKQLNTTENAIAVRALRMKQKIKKMVLAAFAGLVIVVLYILI